MELPTLTHLQLPRSGHMTGITICCRAGAEESRPLQVLRMFPLQLILIHLVPAGGQSGRELPCQVVALGQL